MQGLALALKCAPVEVTGGFSFYLRSQPKKILFSGMFKVIWFIHIYHTLEVYRV